MIIGFDMFDCQFFDTNISSGNIYYTEISNCKADEIKIDTGNSTIYNVSSSSWGENTILQCKFQDLNFEAGNLELAGIPIEYLRIKKRKSGDLAWNTYKDIPFNSNQSNYNWSDKFIQSLETYDYAITPVGSQGIEGTYGIKSVDCDYEDIWILGSEGQQYHLIANLQKGDIQTISPSSFIETIGSQYPYEISNGSISYRKGGLKATLISNSTLSGNNIYSSGIDRKAEKILRENFYKFLTNKKPKVYKDSDGDYMLVSIKADSVKITPNNDLSRMICDLSFDFYEVGDSQSVNDLKNCGLLG